MPQTTPLRLPAAVRPASLLPEGMLPHKDGDRPVRRPSEGTRPPPRGTISPKPGPSPRPMAAPSSAPVGPSSRWGKGNEPISSRPPPGHNPDRPASYARTPDQIRTDTAVRPTTHTTRPYERPPSASERPPYDRLDNRHARPSHRHVGPSPYVYYGPPAHYWYTPYYTHWWMHPYYRYTHPSWNVVYFGWPTYAWASWWVPPPRYGYMWSSGYYAYDMYYPGYWSPIYAPPPSYLYVPGHWSGPTYVEGYYRAEKRDDGDWRWVEGYYLPDGTFVEGHWQPTRPGPEGYAWEPGFFDGEVWVDGYWRPEFRSGFVWVSASYDEGGVRHAGYWLPLESRPDEVWIPGWFDGQKWIPGYWVAEAEFRATDTSSWQPPEGYDAGWTGDTTPRVAPSQRLALPVDQVAAERAVVLPDTERPDTLDVALRRSDVSAFPKVVLDLAVTHRAGAPARSAEGWKVEVWDDGANVEAELAFVEAVDKTTEVFRVTYTARTPEVAEREVVVRLSADGRGNGYQGTRLQLP